MDTAAFDTLATARELEAAGMDRDLAEVAALNMQKAGTAHLDQLATKADLENHRVATKADLENHRVATKADLAGPTSRPASRISRRTCSRSPSAS